jgi:hypothetical protein
VGSSKKVIKNSRTENAPTIVAALEIFFDLLQKLDAKQGHLDVLGQRELLSESAHRPEGARFHVLKSIE